jgi:hypothetical protein
MFGNSPFEWINKTLSEEFKFHSPSYHESLFSSFKLDQRTQSFIAYYNRTVLDKERIRFGEFKHQWAIQGMSSPVIKYFDDNYDALRDEILEERNIKKFYLRHCISVRKEASFCSKLFHTHLPNDFPPLDNPIRNRFNLGKDEFINSVLIVKEAYKQFIEDNWVYIKMVRSILAEPRYSYLRASELSDIRIIDMYLWFKENRQKGIPTKYSL